MKILIIFSIILGVFAAYFVFNAEKSVSIKGGGNAIPAGTDVAKFILNKAKTINPGEILKSGITEEIKSKVGEIKDKILSEAIDLVKQPVKDKATELFCPQR